MKTIFSTNCILRVCKSHMEEIDKADAVTQVRGLAPCVICDELTSYVVLKNGYEILDLLYKKLEEIDE